MTLVVDVYSVDIPAQSAKGTVTYYITALDKAGNTQTSSTFTILVHDLIWDLDSDWNLVSTPKTLDNPSKNY